MAVTFGLLLAVGTPLAAMAGPTPGGPDTDSDGIEDAFDNCTLVPNPNQVDCIHVGCGEVCYGDINADQITNIADFLIWQPCFNQPAACAPAADLNCDQIINIADFLLWQARFNQVPGPSGLPAALKSGGCP
jgi:hypothetical protein